jgi:DNA-binding CsgD family transcriptional regulator
LYVNSFRETLDLALNLHPGTRHVAIVAGADIIGRAWSSAAREAYRPYKNQIEFIDFSGLPMPAILEKVSNLPPKTVVIYIALLEDGDGKKFTAPESLSQISRASNAPVYSFWDLVLGHGRVGGYLSSAEEKGKEIAELGLRILDGEKLAELREIQEGVESLTPREREVFALVVTGMLNKQVAFELGISEKTIKVHRARVMQKMKAESLADLVRLAEKAGVKPVTEST